MNDFSDPLLSQLYGSLKKAIFDSWSCVLEQHSNEHIYTYILYTEPLLGYVLPSFNSEEALARITEPVERDLLRWSPPDWEYHLENEVLFDPVQDLLGELDADRDYEDREPFERRRRIFLDCLIDLDRNSIFGTGDTRQQLTLNLMWGDQNVVDHVQTARELNPRVSYLRYAQAQLPALHNTKIEIMSGYASHKNKKDAVQRVMNTIDMIENDLKMA